MRVCLSTWGSRGDIEPILGLAVALQQRGAEARLCAPPDFAEQAAALGVPLIPKGYSVREMLHGARPVTPADAPRVAADLVAMQFDAVPAAADGCDALVATGLMPAGERSIADRLQIPYVFVAFSPRVLPAAHQRPLPRPGKPFPPGETDNRVLWELDAEKVNALYREPLNTHRAAVGLPPVANVREHVLTNRPWLAADPILGPWPGSPDLDVVQTGAWMLSDERRLPDDVAAFLDAGAPPVYVSLGSVRAPADIARVAIEAARGQAHRVLLGRGWADLALIDDADDCFTVGDVNHRALFARVAAVVHHGGAGTTTTAAWSGVPQVVVAQFADQPYWAARVADLGIGTAHDGPTPTAESLSAALGAALTPGTRARAATLAATIRTNGAAVAAGLLADAVGRSRGTMSL